MLSSSSAAKLKHKLDTSIRKLTSYEGNFPNTNNPQEVAACELFLAQELFSRASSHLKIARETALIEGVIIDPETSELQGKENKQLYYGEHVSVMVNVSEGPVTYRKEDIRAELVRIGLKKEVIDLVFRDAGRKNRNAHKFVAMLVIEQQAPKTQQNEQRIQQATQ